MTDIEELAQVREFNVHRARFSDWSETVEEPVLLTTGTGAGTGASRPAREAPRRALSAGAGQRSRSAGYKIDTKVDHGRLLNFTDELEKERRRAERALHRPRHQEPMRPKVTVPLQSHHLNQLAQPKAIPVEEEPPAPPPPPQRSTQAKPKPPLLSGSAKCSLLAPPPRQPTAAAARQPAPLMRTPVGGAGPFPASPSSFKQARELIHATQPSAATNSASKGSGVTALKAAEAEARAKRPHDHGAAWSSVAEAKRQHAAASSPTTPLLNARQGSRATGAFSSSTGSELSSTGNITPNPSPGALIAVPPQRRVPVPRRHREESQCGDDNNGEAPPQAVYTYTAGVTAAAPAMRRRAASSPAYAQQSERPQRKVHVDPTAVQVVEVAPAQAPRSPAPASESKKCPYTFKVASLPAAPVADEEAPASAAAPTPEMTLDTMPDPPLKVLARRKTGDEPSQWPPAGYPGAAPTAVVARRAQDGEETAKHKGKSGKKTKRRQ
eukprot:gene2324-1460_t